jgi:hypothetical protein
MSRCKNWTCVGLVAIVVGWICVRPMFVSADPGKDVKPARKFTMDERQSNRGTVGQLGGDTVFEVKSHALMSDFNTYKPGAPVHYTIFFFSEKDGQGAGRFWKFRKVEDIQGMTTLMETAWKGGRKVFYDRTNEQLAVGIEPIQVGELEP